MAEGDAHRVVLGQLLQRERVRRGLSVRGAAKQAGIDRATWLAVEEATRVPYPHKAALMEPVVGWGPGSFDSVLRGGDPLPLVEEERPDPAYRALMDAHRVYVREYGLDKANEMLRTDVDEINAARARGDARPAERPDAG